MEVHKNPPKTMEFSVDFAKKGDKRSIKIIIISKNNCIFINIYDIIL